MPKTGFEYGGADLESMGFADRYHRHIIKQFAPYLGQRIVEVGAGDGTVSRLIAERSPDRITAVEPSAKMYRRLVETAKRYPLIKPQRGFLADQADRLGGTADSFVYVNVFEHIEDDQAEMKSVYQLLPPGGHLCIFVPAMPSLYSEFDRSIDHFRRYTKPELEEKCRQAGFSIVKSRYLDWLGVLPWWIRFRLLKSKTMSPGAVKLYDRIGVPIMKATESLIAPPRGKNVLLVAEKPARG